MHDDGSGSCVPPDAIAYPPAEIPRESRRLGPGKNELRTYDLALRSIGTAHADYVSNRWIYQEFGLDLGWTQVLARDRPCPGKQRRTGHRCEATVRSNLVEHGGGMHDCPGVECAVRLRALFTRRLRPAPVRFRHLLNSFGQRTPSDAPLRNRSITT